MTLDCLYVTSIVMEAFSASRVDSIFNGAFSKEFLSSLGELVVRQTIGLDFVFIDTNMYPRFSSHLIEDKIPFSEEYLDILKYKYPICIEINGQNSGIEGVYELEKNSEDTDMYNSILSRRFSDIFANKVVGKFLEGRPLRKRLRLSHNILIARLYYGGRYGDLYNMKQEYFEDKLWQKSLINTAHRVPVLRPVDEYPLYMKKTAIRLPRTFYKSYQF